MTSTQQDASRFLLGGGRRAASATGFAMLATAFVTPVVIWQVHAARHQFIENNPEYMARNFPPTISGALADPTVGEPFHVWITICAILLPLAVVVIASLYYDTGRSIVDIAPRLSKVLRLGTPVTVLVQMVASFGMWMLSGFRFPDHNAEHMLGSYMFFSAQAVVVLIATILCFALARSRVISTRLENGPRGLLRPALCRARALFGLFCVLMTLGYLVLFIAKDMALPVDIHMVYELYVRTELVVISGFVVFLALHLPELWDRWASLMNAGRTAGN